MSLLSCVYPKTSCTHAVFLNRPVVLFEGPVVFLTASCGGCGSPIVLDRFQVGIEV